MACSHLRIQARFHQRRRAETHLRGLIFKPRPAGVPCTVAASPQHQKSIPFCPIAVVYAGPTFGPRRARVPFRLNMAWRLATLSDRNDSVAGVAKKSLPQSALRSDGAVEVGG